MWRYLHARHARALAEVAVGRATPWRVKRGCNAGGATEWIAGRRGSATMAAPKVLVVDDSWTDLALMATPLRDSGFEVITAVDGDEAVEKTLQELPQCVLLDVVLPKQSGFQVCRRLKQM